MTLKELLEGKTFPVKVRRPIWEVGWFEVIADTRTGLSYPGFYQGGSADSLDDYDIERTDWELYTEPKKKKKMYAWLLTTKHRAEKSQLSEIYYTDNVSSVIWNWANYETPTRVPHLDFEMDE